MLMPYGAVLRRVQVRELEAKDQDQMILRVKDEQSNLQLLPESDPEKKKAKDLALQQWQTALEQLSSNPPTGRVAIRISADIQQWQNTVADVEVRAGDSIEIPKKPSYVMVTGQVFNPTAVSYRPGKSANWYLGQSGGPTQLANKKAIFVIRADGSVLSSSQGLWSGEFSERGVATWRHGSGAGEGDRRRRAVADGVPGGAGGVVHRQHGVHRCALLVREIQE